MHCTQLSPSIEVQKDSYAISSILTEFIHKYHSSVHINDIHAVKLNNFQVKHIISGASDIQKHRILMVMNDKVKSRSCLSVSLSVWLTEGQPVQWTLPVRQSMPASMVSSRSQNLLGCAGLHNFKQSADIITLDGRSTCRYHLCFVFPHWNDK